MPWRDSVAVARREQIDRALEPGEQVRWVGAPVPRYSSSAVYCDLVLGLFVLTFAVGWLSNTFFGWSTGPPPGTAQFHFFLLFGLSTFAAGVYLGLTPLREYRGWLRRLYVITNRRMIVFEPGRQATLRRFASEPPGHIVRVTHRDGTCDLLIEPGVSTEYEARSQREPLGFRRIREADTVEALLTEVAQTHPAIETAWHPTHDRPFWIACAVGAVLLVLVVTPLALLQRDALAGTAACAIILAIIAYGFFRNRSALCPRCGANLKRDAKSPRGTACFTCRTCRVRWASRVIAA